MRASAVLAMALVTACGGAAATNVRAVSVRMKGEPANATVTVDDVVIGSLEVVSSKGVALRPGMHRISVEAPGYLPWDRRLEATEAPVVLDVRLEKVPD